MEGGGGDGREFGGAIGCGDNSEDRLGASDDLDGGGGISDCSDRGEGGSSCCSGGAKESDAPTSTTPARRRDAEQEEAMTDRAAPMFRYGQLRMRYVLSKRRRQVGEMGPRDLLILQPTSIGAGIDAGFIEVCAYVCAFLLYRVHTTNQLVVFLLTHALFWLAFEFQKATAVCVCCGLLVVLSVWRTQNGTEKEGAFRDGHAFSRNAHTFARRLHPHGRSCITRRGREQLNERMSSFLRKA